MREHLCPDSSGEVYLIEALDWLGELVLRRPWHSVGAVVVLNVIVVALWIAFEKRRDRR